MPTRQELDGLPPEKRLELISQARAARHQALTTAGVVLTVLLSAIGLYITQKTLVSSQQGQITDRYTKAVEQIASDKREVRTAAIYALERIARDSPADRLAIRDVLAAFIRERDPAPKVKMPEEPETDVAAALTVLARRPIDPADFPVLDLHAVRIHNATFPAHANLRGANLSRADLSGANLTGADLTDANLSFADLSSAKLSSAGLSSVDLTLAKLRSANLHSANLRNAWLRGADLSGGGLSIHLEDNRPTMHIADLREADLRGAALLESLMIWRWRSGG